MSHSVLTAEAFCKILLALSSEERHERLKTLDANDLFCAVMPLLPPCVRDEFWWLEKREYVQTILKHPLTDGDLKRMLEREGSLKPEADDLWRQSLTSLVGRRSAGDELWLFEAVPGDKGYALLRNGNVIDFYIAEVTTATIR